MKHCDYSFLSNSVLTLRWTRNSEMASLNSNCKAIPSEQEAFVLGSNCTTLDCDLPATEVIVVSRIVTLTVPINVSNSSCLTEEMTTPSDTKLRETTDNIRDIVSLPDCDVNSKEMIVLYLCTSFRLKITQSYFLFKER